MRLISRELDDEYSASEGEFYGNSDRFHKSSSSSIAVSEDGKKTPSSMMREAAMAGHVSKIRSMLKNSNLYKLRHNPKRSHRLTDEEFATEARLADSGVTAMEANNKDHRQTTVNCSECGKVFMSLKALFGHMRCHPEREWRGILPPGSIASGEDRASKKMKQFKPPAGNSSQRSIHESGQALQGVGVAEGHGNPKACLPSSQMETDGGLKLRGDGLLLSAHHQANTADDQALITDEDWMNNLSRWSRGKRSRRSSSSGSSGGHGHGKA